MTNKRKPTKADLLKTIEQLEQNPNDKVGIFADVGIIAMGVAVAGAAAFFGSAAVPIPIVTALAGIAVVGAAPVVLVAGSAVAGGAAVYGIPSPFFPTSRNRAVLFQTWEH